MANAFTKLDTAQAFPGTVTKLHAGLAQVQAGDLLQVEWAYDQPFVGTDLAGRVKSITSETRRVGPRGPEAIYKVVFEEGWYSYGFDMVTMAGPEGTSPETNDVVLTGVPTAHRADFEREIELSTADSPGWHAFVIGADTDARLDELSALSGGRYSRS